MSIPSVAPATPASRVARYETIVVGAGQAGLAGGQQLAARDADFVILTDEARIGDNWRRRWDSLRLFTPAKYSSLPGLPFPAPAAHLPDKDEMADYLLRYAERFDLPVRLRTPIESLTWDGSRYVLRSGDATFEADNVIVATGPFQAPRVPPLAARLSPAIHQLHSSAYTNPLALPEGPVLVAGAGNSGAQIALELARFRKVWLAGRPTGYLPRRLLGRDLFDWCWPIFSRATTRSRLGARLRARGAGKGDPLIGIPEREFARMGVARVGRITDVRGGLPVCDEAVLEPRVIVWCTGFVPDYRWIRLPVFDSDGRPRHRRGVVDEAPGLFFLGLRFQFRPTSALVGGVGDDAAWIADQAVRRSAQLDAA